MTEKQLRMAATCDAIIDDMESDVRSLDGQPFNGRTVSEQFGKNMAAIQALARICKEILSTSGGNS